MSNLKEYIKVNDNFKNAINLYLNLNKPDKVLSYIPTKSSINIFNEYIESVNRNIEQSTILVGPYGKGKSHLLLVLLSVLSMERNTENQKVIDRLIGSIDKIDKSAAANINSAWSKKKKFLPVIISSSQSDLNQAFLVALNEALKRDSLDTLTPDTFYSKALENIDTWKVNFKETYDRFKAELKSRNISLSDFELRLKECEKGAIKVFKEIYPMLTSGSQFNPMVTSEVLPLFKNINDVLCEEYGYSGIYIIFDEFSKFIESKDETASGNDMKLIQEICELAQESKTSQLFITLVAHKSIKEYGNYLSKDIINSFTGIEGRITEKFFVTSSKNNYELIQNAIIKDEDALKNAPHIVPYISNSRAEEYYSETPVFKSIFNYEDFKKTIVQGCYPLNPISAYVMLNVSEKIAQNERTLFTFISKDEPNSMARYIANHSEDKDWIIGVDSIYDYFKGIFKKDIANVYVHEEWLKADYAISQCDDDDQVKVLKALALVNIVNKPEELPAEKKVLSNAVNIDYIEETLEQLVSKQLIYFKSSTGKYVFKTTVGADLKKEIKSRRALKGHSANISEVLGAVSDYDYILPKKYNQNHAMTRYFRYEFMDIDTFCSIDEADSFFDESEFCDGKVIALVDDGHSALSEGDIVERIKILSDERLIVIKPSIIFKMLKQVQDYEVIQKLKADREFMDNNKALRAEIEVFEEDISSELRSFISKSYGSNGQSTAYYFADKKVLELKEYDLNKLVSKVCESYYSSTPVINNELINKQVISSSPIKRARKNIIDYILSGSDDESFYSKTNPESTIFRALFVNTDIIFDEADCRMAEVMKIIDDFLSTCEKEKTSARLVLDALSKAPISIRRGVIPLYLAYSMSRRKGDILAYLGEKEFELNTDIVINMCELKDEYSLFISKENAEKEQYIDSLKDMFIYEGMHAPEGSRLRSILISMQRWYRSLPQITRTFKSQPEYFERSESFEAALKIRSLLQKADANPYEIIFVTIPSLLETESDYASTIEKLRTLKQLLENHLSWTVSSLIEGTVQVFDPKSKEDLYHTLKKWYESQSKLSKKGIFSTKVTELMGYIDSLNIFDDNEIVRKLIRIVTGVYVENWTDSSWDSYFESLSEIKTDVENIKDELSSDEQCELSFIDRKGNKVTRCYEKASENSGTIMRNILEETLEDFEDSVSTNDRVAILVEMLEKILK